MTFAIVAIAVALGQALVGVLCVCIMANPPKEKHQ